MLPRSLFKEEHNLFRSAFQKFCEKEIVPYHQKWEEEGIVPRSLWEKAGKEGFLCPWLPEQYGGPGGDFLHSVIITEELARIRAHGFAAGLHSDIVVPYLYRYGTEEQKNRWLPRCAKGEIITAIAMTEPQAGSDLAGIQTTAIKKDGYYILNGQKTFISNGILADLVIVVAKTDPQKDPPHAGISLLVVERGMPGFERGKKLKKMGCHAQDTAELFFQDVKVPRENLLGEEGKGFYYLMEQLQQERLMVAIGAVVGMETAMEEILRYTKERKAFGKPISKFQHISFQLAEMQTYTTIARVFVDRLIEEHMKGNSIVSEVSMAKWWTTDRLWEILDRGVQMFGGYGYILEYPIAKQFLDARVQRIYAGTNEIMKLIIAKQMGL
jgi:acyl-CoA dehydrogenase